MPQLTFVTGLPGSGKSYLTDKFVRETGAQPFDDYQKYSKQDILSFSMSRHYETLIGTLRNGQNCIVNDVSSYDPVRRQDAKECLAAHFGQQIDIKWVFFAKDINLCVQNVCYRALTTKKRGLKSIGTLFKYAVIGEIPDGAEVQEVHPRWLSDPKISNIIFTGEEISEVVISLGKELKNLGSSEHGQVNWFEAVIILQKVVNSFLEQFQST